MGSPAASVRLRGLRGEQSAAEWLAARGYSIQARNFRCRGGEIDIVARKGGVLAFIEVKTWRVLGRADLEYSIGGAKQRRIVMAARHYLRGNRQLAGVALRFDVLLLAGGRIEHLENAFSGSVE